MKEIGELCRSKKIFFHTDAAQAIGKIPVNVNDLNIDLMSISGHKLYGPKGIGAIYVRRRPRVRIEAQISGGGQVDFRKPLTIISNTVRSREPVQTFKKGRSSSLGLVILLSILSSRPILGVCIMIKYLFNAWGSLSSLIDRCTLSPPDVKSSTVVFI